MSFEFLSYILIFGGLYCIYNFYKMRFLKDLSNSILLPKDVNPDKCKDKEAYIKKTSPPLLALGLSVLFNAGLDLYNTNVGGLEVLTIPSYVIVIAVIVWVAIVVRKYNKEYF
ncbi:MAG: hypothetical protein ACK5LL_00690 [Suipraeoptans sp.]